MSDFNLDLSSAEDHLDEEDVTGDVILGVLDGETEPRVWIDAIEDGNVLFLSVEGDLNELATGFAREVKEMGGQLMHFRKFLVVSPPGVNIDTGRL